MTQNRRARKKARLAKIIAAGVVLVLLAVFLLVFRARKIKVYGNDHHSSEEIAADLVDNAFINNTAYMLWKYRDGRVPSKMPYLETIHVQMKSPSRLDVHVTEKQPVAYFDKDGHVYIDQDGMVLEITDQTYAGIPIVTGASMEEPLLYQKLPAQSGAQLRTILSLTQLLTYQGMTVDEIRFGDNMEITLFAGSIEIQLGQDEYLEEKIANLAKIMPRLDGQSGTLHLEGFTGRNEQVPFTPSGTDISSVEDENGQGEGEDGENSGGEGSGDEGSGGEGSGDEGSGDEGSGGEGSGGQSSGGEGGADGQAAGDGSGGEDGADGQAAGDGSGGEDADGEDSDQQDGQTVYPMVFNSSGTLVYNVHVENGTVVDEYGNPVPGVTVNADGNVVDAYMNVFDSRTGELIQQ